MNCLSSGALLASVGCGRVVAGCGDHSLEFLPDAVSKTHQTQPSTDQIYHCSA